MKLPSARDADFLAGVHQAEQAQNGQAFLWCRLRGAVIVFFSLILLP